MSPVLLSMILLPILSVPFIYLIGRKSDKAAGILLALVSLSCLGLVLTTIPSILSGGQYSEAYAWIPLLNSEFSLFVDGISICLVIVTTILMSVAALYSISYMHGKKNLPIYYSLLALLFVGLIGVFITSNLLFFYFCWELMLVPAFFIVGGWGYRDSYRAAFKFFIFTHAGAVFVLLGIGAIYMVTGSTDMIAAQTALLNFPEIAKWILLALTAGFAVKMAIVPVHMWLPDAHAEAPATMSALLSGVIISAGAYAILRLSLGTVFPAVAGSSFGTAFLHGLAIFGVISAFFGAFIALAETDIKKIIAYSSMAHMGYLLFGIALFPIQYAITGVILHIIAHALSKGLLFLSAGSVMKSLKIRNIKEMGGLAGKMPITGTASAIAALSLGGAPPFACFISEFFIFMGAFKLIQTDSFYIVPTALMLIAAILSLAYSLRFISKVFLGPSKINENADGEKKKFEVPRFMQIAMIILAILVIIVGIYPSFFIELINSATALI